MYILFVKYEHGNYIYPLEDVILVYFLKWFKYIMNDDIDFYLKKYKNECVNNIWYIYIREAIILLYLQHHDRR